MIKKILKLILKGILAISLLIGIAYGSFHLWEYTTGGKYVTYLSANAETIPLEQSFSFKSLNEDIENNSLILVGEIHGFEEPQKFDFELFTHLHNKFGVRHYFAELDFVQAKYMNAYLKSGNEELMKSALKKWAVVQGRNNKDYLDKYRKFYQYYSQLDSASKFQFIGVDKIQDLELTSEYLNSFDTSLNVVSDKKVDTKSLLERISDIELLFQKSADTINLLNHIKENLSFLIEKINREKVLFSNFQSLYKRLDLKRDKAYGYFGLFHVFQYQVNGLDPLTSMLRESDLGLENKIVSINFLMVDSYMVMPSKQLPEFMRDAGKHTRMPISADVMLFMYIYGVKDLKRMTPEYHKSLIKMDGENSPYSNSNRMDKTIQILPVADKFEFNEKGKPYVQYTVFVRNSDWAEPLN